MNREIESLSKEQLLELVEIYSKNWLAMDGVWFQSIEDKFGLDEAMLHDERAWRRFTVIEAERIKKFLKLPERSGIDGLKRALRFRMDSCFNPDEIIVDGNTLIYRVLKCRAQDARVRKGMEKHPCKPVGLVEYTYFAKTIDDRFECEALSCYPEIRILPAAAHGNLPWPSKGATNT